MAKKNKLIYPELSYQIIGCLYEVYNQCGAGHRESFYQQALKEEFKLRKIKFQEQVAVALAYKNKLIGKNYLDFLIDDKIILEIKVGSSFSRNNLKQIIDYLKSTNLKLGIIANFTDDKLKFYRVLNIE